MNVTMNIAVYIRVSTKQQFRSGHGIRGQISRIRDFIRLHNAKLVRVFREREHTGKTVRRPQLDAALAYCRETGATLVITELDRLARNVHFISGLMEAKVPFICLDVPDSNPFMLHMKAVFAEEEARRISERTKNALKAAKANGVKLGMASEKGRETFVAKAQARRDRTYGPVLDQVRELREQGHTLEAIANRLNEQGFRTVRNAQYRRKHVHAILAQ